MSENEPKDEEIQMLGLWWLAKCSFMAEPMQTFHLVDLVEAQLEAGPTTVFGLVFLLHK